jgi:hypothetical protein
MESYRSICLCFSQKSHAIVPYHHHHLLSSPATLRFASPHPHLLIKLRRNQQLAIPTFLALSILYYQFLSFVVVRRRCRLPYRRSYHLLCIFPVAAVTTALVRSPVDSGGSSFIA